MILCIELPPFVLLGAVGILALARLFRGGRRHHHHHD
jgi:hypothetical protein